MYRGFESLSSRPGQPPGAFEDGFVHSKVFLVQNRLHWFRKRAFDHLSRDAAHLRFCLNRNRMYDPQRGFFVTGFTRPTQVAACQSLASNWNNSSVLQLRVAVSLSSSKALGT